MSSLPNSVDVIVVGAGAAGLYATLCLPENYSVCLITKAPLQIGSSDWAQGGVAAAIAPDDSPLCHLEDTLKAGAGICDPPAVQFLVENAAPAINRLVELGVAFDRQGQNLALTLEAAHSRPRVLHAADTTGRAIVATLTAKTLQRPHLHVLPETLVTNLWLEQGHCQGVGFWREGELHWLAASAVILATGGGGQVFARTTNPSVSTGDGVALAWRAGAKLRDLEFFQFHPTALTKAGAPPFLISEAVRGEGAHLIDRQGERFTFNYDPLGELAPRDVVSRAIFDHLEKTAPNLSEASVYLDLSPIPRDRLSYRFPNIIQVCQHWGLNIFQEPIPVAPAAHYWMGGISVDLRNQTSIPGLYAIGETASTGVHGANRLASNSLLECLVFASQLAQLPLTNSPIPHQPGTRTTLKINDLEAQIEQMQSIRTKLQELMWHHAGISRHREGLEIALNQCSSWRAEILKLSLPHTLSHLHPSQNFYLKGLGSDRAIKICSETLNLLDSAFVILQSAIFRTESRGGHFRKDYPASLPEWEVHTIIENESGHQPEQLKLSLEAVVSVACS